MTSNSRTWGFIIKNFNENDISDIMNMDFTSILFKKTKFDFEGIVSLKQTSRETTISKKYPRITFYKSSTIESKKLREENKDYNFETKNESVIRILKEENDKKDKLLLNSNNSIVNNTVNNNIINNNNMNLSLNIIINKYSTPDTQHITDYDYHESMIKPKTAFPQLVKKIHFNPDVPQNLNIKHGNKALKKIKVYDDKGWKSMDKNEVIERLIELNCAEIENCTYDENFIQKYPNSKEEYGNFASFFENEDDVTNVKETIGDILYDNNKLVPINN